MKTRGPVRITVPNDVDYIPMLLDSAVFTAQLIGFDGPASEKIRLGLEEAVVNIVEHAFLPRQDACFEVVLEPDNLSLTIRLLEQGQPFDPDAVPAYDPQLAVESVPGSGLGIYLMKQCFDQVAFHNLGRKGKETVLVKYLHKAVHETHEISHNEAAEEPLPQGSVQYTVRRMESHEAVEISRCAYYAYGYGYAQEYIYFPERVREYNRNGKVLSFVAVTADGEIMGHAALKLEDDDSLTAELSAAFVKPKFRGQGCLGRLTDALTDEGRAQKLSTFYARAVTTHPYSQKEAHKQGLQDCAIMLARREPTEFKAIGGGGQRESHIMSYRFLRPMADMTVFAPPKHREMIGRIYRNLGMSLVFGEAETALSDDRYSIIRAVSEIAATATIRVEQFGVDTIAEVRKIWKNFCYERMEAIYLAVPFTDPFAPVLVSAAEEWGFFFSGVVPGTGAKNCLMLQYLNNYRFDYGKIQIASEFGKELLAYIAGSDPNVEGN